MLDPNDAVGLAAQLQPQLDAERERYDEIARWWRDECDPVRIFNPAATQEHHQLAEMSPTPLGKLVVDIQSQAMYVDGIHTPGSSDLNASWLDWQANKFASRQTAIYREALAFGLAYATVLPGTAPDGSPMPVMRGRSARRCLAVYEDVAVDDWPVYALIQTENASVPYLLLDDEAVYRLGTRTTTNENREEVQSFVFLSAAEHGAGECPVVRYANQLDLEGRSIGEVKPLINNFRRINKLLYDRQLVQHFESWKVRYAAGLDPIDPNDPNDPDADRLARRQLLELAQGSVLTSEDSDTRFGTLDSTDMTPFVNATESEITHLAALAQMPTQAMTGQFANLSADALAATQAQLRQKIAERQEAFGDSHAQLLRMGAFLRGDTDGASDFLSRVTWQDTSIRSLSAAADALGKIASQLHVPVRALWPLIPGVTQDDVTTWSGMVESTDPVDQLLDKLEAQAATSAPAAA